MFEGIRISDTDAGPLSEVGGPVTSAGGSWVSAPASEFCSRCDFCLLVFDALERRYGEAIAEAVQELGGGGERDSGGSNVRMLLNLSRLSFYPFSGSREVDGAAVQYKGVSHVLIQGSLGLALDATGAPSEQSVGVDVSLPFEVFADELQSSDSTPAGIYRRALTPNVMSSEGISKIKGWLGECAAKHLSCARLPELVDGKRTYLDQCGRPLFLPTRLVHVGNPAIGQAPRVVLSHEEFKDGVVDADQARYLALSYCWGSATDRLSHLTSDVSTILDRMVAIPWAVLPRAFQDVVLLAIALGVRYVWIDSLCILQGEGGDWQEESATMWSVFSGAFLTVVSAAASSSHSGFLGRPPLRSCRISTSGSAVSYSLRHRPGTKWWGTDRMAEITGKRWITRGWTYQEERLARRVLMFGENKLFFDCRERELCEDTDVWLHRPFWSRIVYHSPGEGDDGDGAALQTWRRRTFDCWQWLCTQYSHRKLTIPEDKLPALSGVAAAVAAKTRSRYLAGLWEDNLMHDLFWDVVGEALRPPRYRAPSWSWASLDSEAVTWRGPRTCLVERCQLHCRVLQSHTALAGPSQFGAITSAHLKLEGHVVGVQLGPSAADASEDNPWSVYHQGRSIAEAKLDLAHPIAGAEAEIHIWALLVSTCGIGKSATRGLLLEAGNRKDGEPAVFCRVGTFIVSAKTTIELETKLYHWRQFDTIVCILE